MLELLVIIVVVIAGVLLAKHLISCQGAFVPGTGKIRNIRTEAGDTLIPRDVIENQLDNMECQVIFWRVVKKTTQVVPAMGPALCHFQKKVYTTYKVEYWSE